MKQATLLSVTTTTGDEIQRYVPYPRRPPLTHSWWKEGKTRRGREGARGGDEGGPIPSSPPSPYRGPLGDLSDFPTGRAGLGARAGGTYHTPSEPYQTNLIECIRPNQGMVRSLNEVARDQGTGARMMTLRRARRPAIGLTGETPPVDTALPFARR